MTIILGHCGLIDAILDYMWLKKCLLGAAVPMILISFAAGG